VEPTDERVQREGDRRRLQAVKQIKWESVSSSVIQRVLDEVEADAHNKLAVEYGATEG
jgi:hypothetical protein